MPILFQCVFDRYSDKTGVHDADDFKIQFLVDGEKAYLIGNLGSSLEPLLFASN